MELICRYTFYEYDKYGRNISIAEVNATNELDNDEIEKAKLKYVYNVDDNIEKIYYPNNGSDKLKGIKFNYNKDKWIVSIDALFSGDEISKIREYVYHNDGKVKTIKDYRNFLDKKSEYIARNYTYDVFDRVTSMEYSNSGDLDNILESYKYKYDKNSNITSKREVFNYPNNKKDEETIYTYNSSNQLVKSEKVDNLSFKTTTSAYRYDSVGNRTYDAEITRYTVADEGDIIESTYHYNSYNKLNQLTAVSEVCAKTDNNNSSSKTYVTRYKYDARGNKKEEVDGKSGDITTYAYDVENQLVDVKVNNKLVQHNEYNGAGQRIKKVEKINSESGDKTETTNYFYEGTLLLYTTDEDGEKTSQNIIGNASNTFATIRYEKEQKEYFYSKDIQGSTTNISDREGNCVGSYDYTDFGETSERIASTVANEICYTGGVYDKTTELYYLNARYYDPEDGVFMSQDTYRGTDTDVASWNLYGYCEGNPVNYVDPSGHIIETVIDVGSILYSGYEMINKPSFINFGFLAWDVGATFLPFVPGSYVGRGVKASLKAISRHKRTYKLCKGIKGIKYIKKAKKAKLVLRAAESISDLNKASSISVGKYKHLKKAYKGVKNVEVHHIIEKRLSSGFKKGIKKSDIMSIPLDKKLHRKFTNRWRKVVPYGKSGKHISKKKMISYCRQVYHDTPKLRKIATHYVENNWR